jgi:hypothetical protein
LLSNPGRYRRRGGDASLMIIVFLRLMFESRRKGIPAAPSLEGDVPGDRVRSVRGLERVSKGRSGLTCPVLSLGRTHRELGELEIGEGAEMEHGQGERGGGAAGRGGHPVSAFGLCLRVSCAVFAGWERGPWGVRWAWWLGSRCPGAVVANEVVDTLSGPIPTNHHPPPQRFESDALALAQLPRTGQSRLLA